MNNGLLAANTAPKRFDPDEYYVGYWGPFRQVSGLENPGETNLSAVQGAPIFDLGPFVHPGGQSGLEYNLPWTTIANEVPFDVEAFELHPRSNYGNSSTSVVITLEVAYGAVGKETIVLDRFMLGSRQAATSGAGVADVIGPFPIKIPAGSRAAMRLTHWNANTGSYTFSTELFQAFFHRRYPRPGTKGVTLPLGNPIVAPRLASAGGADTDTSFADVGTVPFDTHWVVPCPMVGSNLSSYGSAILTVDYAYVDGAGSDVVFADNIMVETNTAEWSWCQNRPIPVNLPAGTLIRARGKYENTGFATFMIAGLTCIGVEDVDPARRPGQSQIVG